MIGKGRFGVSGTSGAFNPIEQFPVAWPNDFNFDTQSTTGADFYANRSSSYFKNNCGVQVASLRIKTVCRT